MNKEKQCVYNARYRAMHRAEIKAQRAANYAANAEKIKVRVAAYQKSHRDIIKTRHAAYYKCHLEERRMYKAVRSEQIHAYNAQYRAANHDRIRIKADAHRDENNKKRAEWRRTHFAEEAKYRLENREKIRAKNAAYRKTSKGKEVRNISRRKRRGLERQVKTIVPARLLTRREWEKIVSLSVGRCFWRSSPRCPSRHHRRMTNPTQDHVIPLSKGGLHVAENVVVSCQFCNSKKGARIVTLL